VSTPIVLSGDSEVQLLDTFKSVSSDAGQRESVAGGNHPRVLRVKR